MLRENHRESTEIVRPGRRRLLKGLKMRNRSCSSPESRKTSRRRKLRRMLELSGCLSGTGGSCCMCRTCCNCNLREGKDPRCSGSLLAW